MADLPNLRFYHEYETHDLLSLVELSITKLDLYCPNSEVSPFDLYKFHKMLHSLDMCGYMGMLMHYDQMHWKHTTSPVVCYNRLCSNPCCVRKRRDRIYRVLKSHYHQFKRPMFVTLTFERYMRFNSKNKGYVDRCWVDLIRLLKSLKMVPDLKYIKVVEITKRRYNQYYFHIHALLDVSSDLTQDLLSDLWFKITKNSYIVKLLPADPGSLSYMCKYMNKAVYLEIDPWEYYKNFYRSKMVSLSGFKRVKSGYSKVSKSFNISSYLTQTEPDNERCEASPYYYFGLEGIKIQPSLDDILDLWEWSAC